MSCTAGSHCGGTHEKRQQDEPQGPCVTGRHSDANNQQWMRGEGRTEIVGWSIDVNFACEGVGENRTEQKNRGRGRRNKGERDAGSSV